MTCPHCGRPVDTGATVCAHCGKPLVAGVPDPSAPFLPPADISAPGGSTEMGAAPPQDSSAPAVGEGTPASPPGYAATAHGVYPPPAGGVPPTPPAPKPRRSRVWLFVGVALALAVVVASAGFGVLYLHGTGLTFPWAASTPTPQGVVLLRDPLTSDVHSWPVQSGACEFANGGYQVNGGYYCLAPAARFPDVDVVVQVRQISGSFHVPFGLTLRSAVGVGSRNRYIFSIASDGTWDFVKVVDEQDSVILQSYTRAIKVQTPGVSVTNTLEVRAKGPQFQFFINGMNVGHATDDTLSDGRIGLECRPGAQVVFNNLLITTIS